MVNQKLLKPRFNKLLGVVLIAMSPFIFSCEETVKKPNIVYVFADQWRTSAFEYKGDKNIKTPNIDRLAAEGLNFTNSVSVTPLCTPYRASLITGRYPTSTGMFLNDLYLPSNELCMPEILKGAGYSTAYIGKWHLDGHGLSTYIPQERRQGWDYWKGAECDHNNHHSHYYTGDSEVKLYWDGYDAFAQTNDAPKYIIEQAEKPFVTTCS